MTTNPDRLYELLPVIYRQRDDEAGLPLRDLLRVLAGQVNLVEADIAQLYENWFIETAQDWVVPYIAELIGYRPVHESGSPLVGGEGARAAEQARARILVPRREEVSELFQLDAADHAQVHQVFPLLAFDSQGASDDHRDLPSVRLGARPGLNLTRPTKGDGNDRHSSRHGNLKDSQGEGA
mgnify:CR=1 FL=1